MVLVWGVFKSMIRFILIEGHVLDNALANKHRLGIRNDLGYYLLLGMEFLVAADVIRTVLHPNIEELTVLAMIVTIRVVLSYFLQKELDHDNREKIV